MSNPRPPSTDLSGLAGLPRTPLLAALADRFPHVHRPVMGPPQAPPGGRAAALERLARIDPVAYATTRNHVDGRVTGLSPWIRHGVLSLAEVRDRALAVASGPKAAEKLVSELAWRDYWRRVQEALGDRILEAIEPPPVPTAPPPRPGIPADVLAASTGLPCMDAFVQGLVSTGSLHNHERMWLASWLVHGRGVDWRAGADWFLEHLIDGDPASNHLSWQWVAGRFSAKPYLARRATLEGCTDGRHCRECRWSAACPVDLASGPQASTGDAVDRPSLRLPPAPPWQPGGGPAPRRPLVWLSLDSASEESPAARRHRDAPRLFVVDRAWVEGERVSLARLAFLFECLADVPNLVVEEGNPAEVCPRVAARLGCDGVATAETPCPRFRRAAETVGRILPLTCHAWPRFVDGTKIRDLGRFSRYWKATRDSALEPTLPEP